MGALSQTFVPGSLATPSNWRARWLFPAYLVFTVVFYCNRYLMQWGSPETTIYDQDAPVAVRIIKDVVWLLVLGICLWRTRWRCSPQLLTVVSAFVAWMGIAAAWHAMFTPDELADVALYWVRYPLEYIPIVLVLPDLVDYPKILKDVALAMGWLVTAFLAYEAMADRAAGFPLRYGSIFGSPNDFGIYAAFMLLVLVVYGRNVHHYILAFAMAVCLFASGSRSAWLAFIVGLLPFFGSKRVYRGVLCAVVLSGVLWAVATYGSQDLQAAFEYAEMRATQMDESASIHAFEFRDLPDVSLSTLLIGEPYKSHESTPVVLLKGSGLLAVLLFFSIVGMSLVRGWRRRSSVMHGAAFITLLTIAAGSMFIPYIDTFPTNFYLWLAIGLIWLPETEPRDRIAAGGMQPAPVPVRSAELFSR